MKAIWSNRAVKSLHTLEEYILRRFGEPKRQQFMREVEQEAIRLEEFPHLGKPEPLLAHRRKAYCSWVVTPQTKLIYYVSGQQLVIANIWDVRQEPKTMTKGL